MRILVALLPLAALLAGCASPPPVPLVACDGALHPVTLYFADGHALVGDRPEGGNTPGNSFAGGFLSNDLQEWLSNGVDRLHLEGNVSLSLYLEYEGTPAPIPRGDPGDGYQLFDQFGSSRTFQPGYAVETAPMANAPGTIQHVEQAIALPPGGFELERGDRVRVLLTSLALDGPSGSGHRILFGSPYFSQVSFQAACAAQESWAPIDDHVTAVNIPGNQGLFTGDVPKGPLNLQTVPLDLKPETRRLTIDLHQTNDANPVKDDLDLNIVDGNGASLWSIGSPYSDEHGVLWGANLDWLRAHGAAAVEVDSYSGVAYAGSLDVTQDTVATA